MSYYVRLGLFSTCYESWIYHVIENVCIFWPWHATLLDKFFVVQGETIGRSRRDRKPVKYTFGMQFLHSFHIM